MNDLIQDIAKIEVPHDLLAQIDVNDVLLKFRNNFKRLDELKRARNEHEQRNALMRWWHNDKLKDAQLDAQELQAEFSKSLAQLMVISMMQSQKLAHQQDQIGSQQRDLKRQTERLESHTVLLDQQQQKLHIQAVELKNLVNDFFELRGLTQEGAKQLIAIASEVKGTRNELIQSVQATADSMRDEHAALEQFVKDVAASLSASVMEKTGQLSQQVDAQCAALTSRLEAAQAHGAARLDEIAATLSGHMSHTQTQGEALVARIEATDGRHAQAQLAIDGLVARQQAMNAGIEANGTRIGVHADSIAQLKSELEASKKQSHELKAQLEQAENTANLNAAKFNDANVRVQRLARISAACSVVALVGVVVSLANAAHWIHF
jgi:DNA repair exonuclease SbcCD ATPase subunit